MNQKCCLYCKHAHCKYIWKLIIVMFIIKISILMNYVVMKKKKVTLKVNMWLSRN